MESNGISRCVCPVGGKGAARPWGPSSRDGFDSGAGVHQEVLNDLRARIRAGRPAHKRGSYATQTKTKTKGWKPPKVGGCTDKKCPQNCGLSHVAQNTAKPGFLAHDEPWMWFGDGKMAQNGPTWATEGPILGLFCTSTFHLHTICHGDGIELARCGPQSDLAPIWVILSSRKATSGILQEFRG